MSNPGSNLLNIALRSIRPSRVDRFPYLGRSLTPDREYVATWGPAVAVRASMQPLERKAIVDLGLDVTKSYAYLYATTDMFDVQPDGTADRVGYAGGVWDVVGKTDWFTEDGWMRVLCVRLP